MRMLKRENDLRFSTETQNLYDCKNVQEASIPPMHIEDDMQRQVLREHDIPDTDANLHLYRCLNGMYLDDMEVGTKILSGTLNY